MFGLRLFKTAHPSFHGALPDGVVDQAWLEHLSGNAWRPGYDDVVWKFHLSLEMDLTAFYISINIIALAACQSPVL